MTDDMLTMMNDFANHSSPWEPGRYFPFGFHLNRSAWELYQIRELLPKGPRTGYREVHAIRELSDRLNRSLGKDLLPPQRYIHAGELMTLGLLQEVLRFVLDYYLQVENPGSLQTALEELSRSTGDQIISVSSSEFCSLFPPSVVIEEQKDPETYLQEPHGELNGQLITIEEMILLDLAMANPAMQPFQVLFNDVDLRIRSPYKHLVNALEEYFQHQTSPKVMGLKLFETLRAPMRACPHSLEGQLGFILDTWTAILPPSLRKRLLLSRDILREETTIRGFGPGPAPVLTFKRGVSPEDLHYPEFERFTPDRDWMTNLVLIAKSTYVWLDQLSKKYSREIRHLDQIPDEELDQLAAWGFTGLWLIGLWERSSASQRIKQICGNPEALASAYSLYDYVIASDLGGEQAYQRLKVRAAQRGIRLASDMVPNHVGLFSRWIVEHPDWFIQLPYPPFPGYRFTGPNLSEDPRIGLYIEDGYWNHSDAAVVFKRVDHATGATTYIYHGNDGTHMPWNDTAQLNYLIPEVREAVIQTILHVARMFPIIRFDAAMTLTKRHYQRLWFPLPGHGGDIPSRAEQGLSRQEFDRAMPEEFWREVVDRIASEAPDTLLLAEAFWLMEGFFVRTLGMHRVYNSAFMNMLKNEENANYRTTIRNVLEFSPEVLKRFVCFMNNPDEKTAVEQFGKGDKYFGVLIMMVTMPGLPMFGHGQIQGFSEKYGMEYRRAYWDETEDSELIRRHEQVIFPLMRQRHLFAGVDHFAFFDFHTPEGYVNENVFAYSNRWNHERTLIFYNNNIQQTEGRIISSTAINIGKQEQTHFVHLSLGEALDLKTTPGCFYIFEDHCEHLQYIRDGNSLVKEGFHVRLRGYQARVFLNFIEVQDLDGNWGKLAWELEGRGVPDIFLAHQQMTLRPILSPFWEYLDCALDATRSSEMEPWLTVQHKLLTLKENAQQFGLNPDWDIEVTLDTVCERMKRLPEILNNLETRFKPIPTQPITTPVDSAELDSPAPAAAVDPSSEPTLWSSFPFDSLQILCQLMILSHGLSPLFESDQETTSPWMEKWLITHTLSEYLKQKGDLDHHYHALMIQVGMTYPLIYSDLTFEQRLEIMIAFFEDSTVRKLLDVHEYDNILWFNKECFENLMLFILMGTLTLAPKQDDTTADHYDTMLKEWLEVAAESGYRVTRFMDLIV